MPTNTFYQAALLILCSELFLVCSGMVVKQVSGDLPTALIVFARNLFGLVLLLPWLLRNGMEAVSTDNLRFHLLRAGIGVSAMMCLYYSWGHLPLAQAALLKQTAPFFTPILAFFWLGERLSIYTKLGLAVGFAGVYLVLNPGQGIINYVVLIALCGAMLSGCVKVVVRRMSGTESPQRIVFYFAFFSTILSFLPALYYWTTPTLEQLGWLFLMAVTSTIAQLLLSKGYGLAAAGQLAPYTYASVAFAAVFGWWIWDEVLGLETLSGIALIFTAGLLALNRRSTDPAQKN